MTNKSKISLVLLTALISLWFAGFAHAQQERITGADIRAGAASQAACTALGTRINSFFSSSGKNYSTQYFPAYDVAGDSYSEHYDAQCHIVETLAGSNRPVQTQDAKTLENAILNSRDGYTLSTYQSDQTKNNQEKGDASLPSMVVGWILSFLINILTSLVASLTNLAGYMFSYALEHTRALDNPPFIIDIGWGIIRDLMNLMFIISLIVISIATILRIESYSYKNLLVKLILMALLINFSKVIATTIIGFFDSITLAIVGNNFDFFNYSNFFKGLWEGYGKDAGVFASGGVSADLIRSISGLAVAFVALVVFLALAAMLFIRMIGLWFLVMISPVAYGLNILPATKQYSAMWWKTFFKYLIWAPVSVLFLKIGTVLINRKSELLFNSEPTFDYILIAGFMLGALMVTKTAGMVGANTIHGAASKALNKGANWGKAAGKFTAGAAGSMAVRGTYLKGAGTLATKAGFRGAGERLTNAGNWVNTKTAKIKTMPGAIKGKLIDAPNAARKKEVEKQAARWQLGMNRIFGMTGLTKSFDEVTKDNAALLKPEIIAEMMEKRDERINAAFIAGIKEHGSRRQLNTLLHGVARGDITGDNALEVRKQNYLSTGGKEKDWDAFVLAQEKAKVDRGDVSDIVYDHSKAGDKDYYKQPIRINRRATAGGETAAAGGAAAPQIIITDANRPAQEMSAEERRQRRIAAAGNALPGQNPPPAPPAGGTA